MSDKAITRRLRQADELRELSLSLMKAKKDSDERAKNNEQAGNLELEKVRTNEK